jgi:hypothetical protein
MWGISRLAEKFLLLKKDSVPWSFIENGTVNEKLTDLEIEFWFCYIS